MIRTQISLSEQEYKLSKKEASKLGISLAEFFRRALKQMLPISHEKPWMKYAGSVESGNPNSSQEIDELVYGQKN